MTTSKLQSAYLKVQRATKHIGELIELLREKRPFTYVLETDTQANTRATYARRDVSVIEEATVIVGDVLYNLRSALDHAYWQIVSPTATDRRAERAIQFPFSETAAGLEKAVKSRYADKVSPEFLAFIIALKPHGEPGGNDLLHLLHNKNGVDKHRTLIPVGDYKKLSSEDIRRQVPDFPRGIINSGFGQNRRDVIWELQADVRATLETSGNPVARIIEMELVFPVQVTFSNEDRGNARPLVPTLEQLVDLTGNVVGGMATFA